MQYFVVLLLLWCTSSYARIVSELEPNNGFNQTNEIMCGDTVLCAHMDIGSGDFYRMIVPGGDSVYFRTFACEGNENTVVLLYDSTFALMGINDDSGPMQFSTLGAFVPTSRLCYLQVVHPASGSTGAYTLSYTCQTLENSGHDLCSQARPVTFFPYYDESSTLGAGNEIGSSSPDVFYQFSLATPGDIFIQVCTGTFDARVQLLTQCVGGMMDDASEGTCQLGADLFVFGLQAQTYYILVEGTTASQFGEFTIEISPVLQECPAPEQLIIFDVGGFPFLDWLDVPDVDYFLIEQSTNSYGPFEALATSSVSFWQDPLAYGVNRRFYRVRSICE